MRKEVDAGRRTMTFDAFLPPRLSYALGWTITAESWNCARAGGS